MTLRDDILRQRDCPREKVTLEDGLKVWVHGMTGGQAAAHQTWILDAKGKVSKAKWHKQDAYLVVLTCRDENGTAVFTLDDIPALCELPNRYLAPAIEAAQRLSGLKSIEELAKNSDETDSDNSP